MPVSKEIIDKNGWDMEDMIRAFNNLEAQANQLRTRNTELELHLQQRADRGDQEQMLKEIGLMFEEHRTAMDNFENQWGVDWGGPPVEVEA